jgi:hypothetical protein
MVDVVEIRGDVGIEQDHRRDRLGRDRGAQELLRLVGEVGPQQPRRLRSPTKPSAQLERLLEPLHALRLVAPDARGELGLGRGRVEVDQPRIGADAAEDLRRRDGHPCGPGPAAGPSQAISNCAGSA